MPAAVVSSVAARSGRRGVYGCQSTYQKALIIGLYLRHGKNEQKECCSLLALSCAFTCVLRNLELRYKRIIWRDGVDPDIYRVRRILSRIGTIYPEIVVSVHGSDAITDIWSVVLVVFPDLLSDSTLRPAIGLNVQFGDNVISGFKRHPDPVPVYPRLLPWSQTLKSARGRDPFRLWRSEEDSDELYMGGLTRPVTTDIDGAL